MEVDKTTDHEIANLYQQVFKEDPEHPLARGHFKGRTMGKDTTNTYRRNYYEKKMEMDRACTTDALRIISPVTLSSGTLRGLEEEVAQSNPGGEV